MVQASMSCDTIAASNLFFSMLFSDGAGVTEGCYYNDAHVTVHWVLADLKPEYPLPVNPEVIITAVYNEPYSLNIMAELTESELGSLANNVLLTLVQGRYDEPVI